MSLRTRAIIVLTLGVLVATVGVIVVHRDETKSLHVGQVLDDPGSLYGSTVQITGRVSRRLPAVGTYRVFSLSDGTGTLWVVTKLSVPPVGARIRVKGRVNASIGLGPVRLPTYIVERGREYLP